MHKLNRRAEAHSASLGDLHMLHTVRLHLHTAAFVLGIAIAAPTTFAQLKYDLLLPSVYGSPITATSPRANLINEKGQTVLNRVTSFVVWQDGNIVSSVDARTDYPSRLSRVEAASINALGQVVGSKTYKSSDASGYRFDTFPFYWDAENGLVDLADLGARSASGEGNTSLHAINDRGVAIGYSRAGKPNADSTTSAFLWSQASGRIDIPALDYFGATSHTVPEAINNQGTVVGIYRKFLSSTNHYFENGFVYDWSHGSRSLETIDPAFFSETNYTARAINENQSFVGEIGVDAYVYHLSSKQGVLIPRPAGFEGSMRAYAISETGFVAGALAYLSPEGDFQLRPFIWSEESGTIDLFGQLSKDINSFRSLGFDPSLVSIVPKSINSQGQISAILRPSSGSEREIILSPRIQFDWSSIERIDSNGVPQLRFTYLKDQVDPFFSEPNPATSLTFECSRDLENWNELDLTNPSYEYVDSDRAVTLVAPLADCFFIRARLSASTSL